MDLKHLALCHCSNHEEVFLYEAGKEPVSFRSPELKDNIIYVSPVCPEPDPTTVSSLSEVPPNSIDYIWPIFCPIYPVVRGGSDTFRVFNNIMEYGWNSLKLGGKFVLELDKQDEPYIDNFKELIKQTSRALNKPWKIEYIEDFTTLPLFVHKKNRFRKQKGVIPKNVIILTKLGTGGKKTRRRKTRKVLRFNK